MKEALAMDPTWPGERVDLALRQITRARQVGHWNSAKDDVKDVFIVNHTVGMVVPQYKSLFRVLRSTPDMDP
jgi:hypothetical protein